MTKPEAPAPTEELIAFLRGHHAYCTARDERFELAADRLATLEAWAIGPHGVRWYIDQLAVASTEKEAMREALEEALDRIAALVCVRCNAPSCEAAREHHARLTTTLAKLTGEGDRG